MTRRIAILAVLVATGSAGAQDQAGVRADVLDASPRLGSRYNPPVPQFRAASFGNLYITGNITGGKSFQARVPYGDVSQFQSSLGSSALSSFSRDSIGLADVGSGRGLGTALPYYNPSSTILPLSAQEQGLAAPGSAIPRRSVLPQDVDVGAQLMATEPRALAVALPPGVRTTDILAPDVLAPALISGTEFVPVLGVGPSRGPGELRPTAGTPGPEGTPSQQAPEGKNRPAAEPMPRGALTSELLGEAELAAQEDGFQVVQSPNDAAGGDPAEQLARQAHLTGLTQTQPYLVGPAQPGRAVRARVGTLAGTGSGPFDQTMRAAADLLAEGRCFPAAEQYRRALHLAGDDPFARLGEINALIAAGDLRGSADLLWNLLPDFPVLAHLNWDGSRLLGGPAVLTRRLDEVRSLRIRPDQRELLALAGYLELLADDRPQALRLFYQAGVIAAKSSPAPPVAK